MINWLIKKYTKGYTKVPLFWVNFDLIKYNQFGEEDSCNAYIHPELKDDRFVHEALKGIIEHIRNNCDMDSFVK